MIYIRIYSTLIVSLGKDYNSVYIPRNLEQSKKAIYRVQNACAYLCLSVPKQAHVTPFINKHNMLKNDAMHRQLHLTLCAQACNSNRKPKYLIEKLKWAIDVLERRTRKAQANHINICISNGRLQKILHLANLGTNPPHGLRQKMFQSCLNLL